MELDLVALTPPKRLALAYAKQPEKNILTLLLLFDVKLGQIMQRSNEPLIAQMRLAWWRDVISKDATQRPTGEPLIACLNSLHIPEAEEAMLDILAGWEELIANVEWDEMTLRRHATSRAKAIFVGFGKASGVDYDNEKLLEAGARWAIADTLNYCRDDKERDAVTGWILDAEPLRLPRKLRPLSILMRSVRENVTGSAILWHALTGR